MANKYNRYFNVECTDKNNISYEKDYEKIDKMLSKVGYFILITSDSSLTSEEILEIYRAKDVIEKSFDDLKNTLDFKRLHTHF